jgi:hypothetical protein
MNYRGARRPPKREIREAIEQVHHSGVVKVIEPRLRRRRDARARLSLLGSEVALTLHGYVKGHDMHLVDVVRLINPLDSATLVALGMPNWTYDGCYDRFHRLHKRVAAALLEGWLHIDPSTGEETIIDRAWYLTTIERAAVPLELVKGCVLAIDWTGMDTWARLRPRDSRSTVRRQRRPSRKPSA